MKLLAILRRFAPWPTLLLAILVGVLSGLASTGLLIVIDQANSRETNLSTAALAWRFAGLVLLVAASRFTSSVILARLGARAATTLQVQLARRIVAAPLRRLEEVGPARLMASLVDDVTEVSHTLTVMPNSMINAVVIAGSLCYMGYLSLRMLGGIVLTIAVGSSLYRLLASAGAARQRQAREREDELFESLRGLTQGTKELKMRRARSERFVERLEEVATTLRGLRVQAQQFFVGAGAGGHALFFVVVGSVLFAPPSLLHLTAKTRTGYIFLLLYIIGPLQSLLNLAPDLSAAEVAVRKIEKLGLSLLEEAEGPAAAARLAPAWRRLELSRVCHTYRREDGDTFSLGPLDLAFEPGELVFVIGGNGSGKTTLVKILLGLYLPEKGDLRWDGERVTEDALDRYRRMFSVVFSDFFLFEELFGLEAPDLDDRARRYLGELRLKHKVRIERGRLSTTELSQGQRKRLALLTAYLEESPIFVFDEWAADQDPEFKAVFYREMLPDLKARGKTIVVISHDDRYYGIADRIVKLDSGQLVYDGPARHTDLLGTTDETPVLTRGRAAAHGENA